MDKSQAILSNLHLIKEEKKKQEDFKVKALSDFKLTFKAMYSHHQDALFNAGIERVDYTDSQKLDIVIAGLGSKLDGYISIFLEPVEEDLNGLYRIKARYTMKRVTYDLGCLDRAETDSDALVVKDSLGVIRAQLNQEESITELFPWFVESIGDILQIS